MLPRNKTEQNGLYEFLQMNKNENENENEKEKVKPTVCVSFFGSTKSGKFFICNPMNNKEWNSYWFEKNRNTITTNHHSCLFSDYKNNYEHTMGSQLAFLDQIVPYLPFPWHKKARTAQM